MLKGIGREATYYYHPDHLGSVSVVSNHRGEPYERVEYLPFGEIWIEETDPATAGYIPFRFTSKELDEETGLYYYGARYYEPTISRWMSADPAGFELVNPENNEQLIISGSNWYSYTENNPVKYNDPRGGVPVLVISAVFGGLAGGAIGAASGVASAVIQGNTSNREIIGGAVGGAISGAVTGALIGSGVGILAIVGGSTAGGAAGSVAENLIAKGAENLDAKTVAIDAAIDGGISGGASLLGVGLGKLAKHGTKFRTASKTLAAKILVDTSVGTVFDIIQDNVNPPSSSDLGRAGSDTAQDNVNPQQSDRKYPIVNSPPSHWPKDDSNDD